KAPLTVEQVKEEEMEVSGPSGGEYEIYYDGDTRLVAKPGNRKYSSYCKDLRKVGEWIFTAELAAIRLKVRPTRNKPIMYAE
ncbi:hypothetical protein HRED_08466, partial [Candidatus Haloredivivus sp. G17]